MGKSTTERTGVTAFGAATAATERYGTDIAVTSNHAIRLAFLSLIMISIF